MIKIKITESVDARDARLAKAARERAVAKYGRETCLKAYRYNQIDGEGANTVGIYLGLTTRQADAAINAGRELAHVND